jgi:hypothetical protein
MSNFEQSDAAIFSLPSTEFEGGKLEVFAQEAIAEFAAGYC